MKKEKTKNTHSMFSNIFYFVKLLFQVSPWLVIGEFIWGIMMHVPSRLISVIGVKYIIDTVESGENLEKIFVAVGVIALIVILSNVFTWVFRELFWNMERERVYYGLNKKLYAKARQLDEESYDNPDFYNNFILTIESSSDNKQNLLGLVRYYVGNIILLISISSVLLTIDPVALVIILFFIGVFSPISKKIGNLQMGRRIDNTRFHRRSDNLQRIYYFQD